MNTQRSTSTEEGFFDVVDIPSDILYLITKSKSIQDHINYQMLDVNARIAVTNKEDTYVRITKNRLQLHSIKKWQFYAKESFCRILQDFTIETMPLNRATWEDVFREMKRCYEIYKICSPKLYFSYDQTKNEVAVCGLKNDVETIVGTIKETVAYQIPHDETAGRECILHTNSECRENNTHTDTAVQYETTSDKHRYSELCRNNFTYCDNHGKDVATGKNNNTSEYSREVNLSHNDSVSFKAQRKIEQNVTLDNELLSKQDSAITSNTTKPIRKGTTNVKSACELNKNYKKRTSKKKRRCRSALALLTQYVLITVFINPIAALPQPSEFNSDVSCLPTFSDTGQDTDRFRKLDCYIPTCSSVSKILYEKTDVHSPEQWKPVFVGIDKTNFHSLDAGNGYTLSNRHDYYAFQTNHILYIDPISLEDNGKWRCVVVKTNNIKYESNAVNVQINVTPNKEKLRINPINPNMVTGENHDFTCSVDAVYPKPDIAWYVNGIEYGTGTSVRHTQEDGLWYIKNTITVGFDSVGNNELSCVLQTKPMRRRHISIDVKESVTVLNPVTDMNIAIQKTSMLILLCSGVGYKPKIRWEKGGNTIEETDDKYNIQNICDSEGCTGSITPIIDDSLSACLQLQDYVGVYTCVISLELPYNSSQVSSKMNVYTPENLCSDQSTGLVIGLTVLSSVCVAITMIIVAIVVLLLNHRHRSSKKTFRVQLRHYMQVNPGQLPGQDV